MFTTSWAWAFCFIVLLSLTWIKKSLWENDDFNQAKGISGVTSGALYKVSFEQTVSPSPMTTLML